MTPRRRHRPPSSTTLLVLLAVVAAIVASIGTSLAILEHVRLSNEVERLDDVVHAQAGEARRINASRRAAVLIVCKETEGLKIDLRLILRRFGVGPNELPHNPASGRRALAPTNCRERAVELVPLTRSGHAGPPAPSSSLRGRYGIR